MIAMKSKTTNKIFMKASNDADLRPWRKHVADTARELWRPLQLLDEPLAFEFRFMFPSTRRPNGAVT